MTQRVKVLAMGEHPPALDARRFEVRSGASIDQTTQVVLALTERPINDRQATALKSFVRRGGGLVLAGGTLAAWSGAKAIRELAAWLPAGPGPLTELIVRPDPDHPVTQRLEPEWKIRDTLYLSEGPPAGASILLRSSWRFTEQVVAYERRVGEGRFVYLGLRGDTSSTFEKLLGRTVLFAAGMTAADPVGVGLLGYGANRLGSDLC